MANTKPVIYCYNKKIAFTKNGKEMTFNKLKGVYTHEDGTRTYYDVVICNAIKEAYESEVNGQYPINITLNDYFVKKEENNGYSTTKLFVKSYNRVEKVEFQKTNLEDYR